MELYVLRHAETACNLTKRYNGKMNEPLTPAGIIQAELMAQEISLLDLNIIYTSPLQRATITCERVNKNNTPLIFESRLLGRDCGNFQGKDLGSEYNDIYWNTNIDLSGEGVESIPDLFKRVHGLIDELKVKHKNESVLLVTHAGNTRAIHFYFNPLPEDGLISNYGYENCELRHYIL